MKKLPNLISKRFGRLEVLSKDSTIVSGKAKWICRCDCGVIKSINNMDLQKGNTKSCGCLRKELIRKNYKPGESGLNRLFNNYKYTASIRSLLFSITKEEFRMLTQSNCYYCNASPAAVQLRYKSEGQSVDGINHSKYVYNGLDRKNNIQGYTCENVVPCCQTCNYFKRSRNKDEFITLINKIYNHLNR